MAKICFLPIDEMGLYRQKWFVDRVCPFCNIVVNEFSFCGVIYKEALRLEIGKTFAIEKKTTLKFIMQYHPHRGEHLNAFTKPTEILSVKWQWCLKGSTL